MAKWAFQMTPYDEWDFDGINEMILADINVKGKPTRALVHFDRNGFGYTLDRTNGALLVAEKYDPAVNWATHVDMKSGRPQVVAKYSTAKNGPEVDTKGVCPAALGSKDEQPASFNEKNGRFYVPTNHVCMLDGAYGTVFWMFVASSTMALANGAEVRDVEAAVGARRVPATEIRLAPYHDDPARSRYERFAETTYVFTLSKDVPGAVLEMRSELRAPADAAKPQPLVVADVLRFSRIR